MKVFLVERADCEGIPEDRICFSTRELAEGHIVDFVNGEVAKYPNLFENAERKPRESIIEFAGRFYGFDVVELDVFESKVVP